MNNVSTKKNFFCYIGYNDFYMCYTHNQEQLTNILLSLHKLFNKDIHIIINNVFNKINKGFIDTKILEYLYYEMSISRPSNSIKRIKKRIYDFKNLYPYKNLIKENDIIFEIGGGNGDFTRSLAYKYQNNYIIFELINDNIFLNNSKNDIIYYKNSLEMMNKFNKIDKNSINIISSLHCLHHLTNSDLDFVLKKFDYISQKNCLLLLREHNIQHMIDIKIINISHLLYILHEKKIKGVQMSLHDYVKKFTIPCNYKTNNQWDSIFRSINFYPIASKNDRAYDKSFNKIYIKK